MGLKQERKSILNYKSVYNSIQFSTGKNTFRLTGKILEWSHIEIIARIFYKKFERLLYGDEITDTMYETSIKKVLYDNKMLDDTLFTVLKKKEFQYEAMNIMLIKIFDFVYFNIKNKLPYTKILSLTSATVSELLENTFKYTNGEYVITAGIMENKAFPVVIKLENRYDDITAPEVQASIKKLKEGIEEVNAFTNPDEAYLHVMQNRLAMESEMGDNDTKKSSRLGFAKMRADTKGMIKFLDSSKAFGNNGISILVEIPLKFSPKEELQRIIRESV